MIPILNNILYYLNLAALLQFQHEANQTQSDPNPKNVTVLLQQIPPGPIVAGAVVKFICSAGSQHHHPVKCVPGVEEGTREEEVLYEWEMYQYLEGKNGSDRLNVNIVKLPGQDAEMELKFNDSVSTNPSARCDVVCTLKKNNHRPSSASIKLTFKPKEARKVEELRPPSNFKMLDISSRAAYFSWNPPTNDFETYLKHEKESDDHDHSEFRFEDIVGYIIEYKNGRGTVDWKNEKVTRYEIKDGESFAACVSNLKPWTAYHFRIMSCTKDACSKPSLPLVVRTLEDLPSGSPTDVKAVALDERTLEISWKPPPRSTWNGGLLGYNVGLKRASSPDDVPFGIHMFNPLETLSNLNVYRTKVSDATVPYKVAVQAFNNIGSGPFSEPVTQEIFRNPKS